MVKVLEAKYGDYGFFLGWEKDRTFSAFVKSQAATGFASAQFYYKKHMPYQVRKVPRRRAKTSIWRWFLDGRR